MKPYTLTMDAQPPKKLYLTSLALGWCFLGISYSRRVLCLSRALTCGVGFSTLQERVFKIDGFVFGGWMSFLTYLSWTVLSLVEMAFKGKTARHVSYKVRGIVIIPSMAVLCV